MILLVEDCIISVPLPLGIGDRLWHRLRPAGGGEQTGAALLELRVERPDRRVHLVDYQGSAFVLLSSSYSFEGLDWEGWRPADARAPYEIRAEFLAQVGAAPGLPLSAPLLSDRALALWALRLLPGGGGVHAARLQGFLALIERGEAAS